jgi:hypothetical protein
MENNSRTLEKTFNYIINTKAMRRYADLHHASLLLNLESSYGTIHYGKSIKDNMPCIKSNYTATSLIAGIDRYIHRVHIVSQILIKGFKSRPMSRNPVIRGIGGSPQEKCSHGFVDLSKHSFVKGRSPNSVPEITQ